MPPETPENQFDERQKKAFDYSVEAAKLLITVATGIVSFTIVFIKDFIGGVGNNIKWVVIVAWLCYFVSVIIGIFFIQALIAELDSGNENLPLPQDEEASLPGKPTVWAGSAVFMAQAQQISFLCGLLITLAFGALALYYPGEKPAPPCVICASSPTPAPSAS